MSQKLELGSITSYYQAGVLGQTKHRIPECLVMPYFYSWCDLSFFVPGWFWSPNPAAGQIVFPSRLSTRQPNPCNDHIYHFPASEPLNLISFNLWGWVDRGNYYLHIYIRGWWLHLTWWEILFKYPSEWKLIVKSYISYTDYQVGGDMDEVGGHDNIRMNNFACSSCAFAFAASKALAQYGQ